MYSDKRMKKGVIMVTNNYTVYPNLLVVVEL
jgi:hypothetical protein